MTSFAAATMTRHFSAGSLPSAALASAAAAFTMASAASRFG